MGRLYFGGKSDDMGRSDIVGKSDGMGRRSDIVGVLDAV